ncbi:MAG TPA: hypothetical protein VKI64_03790 [Acidimicrobiales bacterium]|nr:hypothetical protein [Acidimicrobiales bacterium]
MIKRDLTSLLHPVQEDLARVSGFLEGASLADNVAETRALARELCARIESLETSVGASVTEAGVLREESGRLVGDVADQVVTASGNLEGLAKDLADRLSELGSAIETQALIVAPRIIEEVAAAFQLPPDEPRRSRLRRRSDVGAALATATLRDELVAIREDLAPVSRDRDRLVPTLDALADRQIELEQKIDALADAVSRLATKQDKDKKAPAPSVALSAKDRASLVSAIAEAVASGRAPKAGAEPHELERPPTDTKHPATDTEHPATDTSTDPSPRPGVRHARGSTRNGAAGSSVIGPRRRRTPKADRADSRGSAVLSSVRGGEETTADADRTPSENESQGSGSETAGSAEST